jgi:hypothetical protein
MIAKVGNISPLASLTLDSEAKDKDKDCNGPPVSVLDNGSIVLLLGTAILVLAIASRRFALR